MNKSYLIFSILFFSVVAGSAQSKITRFIEPANMDVSVKPGDDFYKYANGTWIKKNPVPPSKTRWSSFAVLAEEASESLKALLEDAAKNPSRNRLTQMVGEFYASAMDSTMINKLGYTPIKPDLDKIAAISSLEGVKDAIA